MILPDIRVEFLREKSEASDLVRALCKKLQNEQGNPIARIKSDHGRKFENSSYERSCDEEGICQDDSVMMRVINDTRFFFF